jgi:hypothetical protein
MTSITTSRNTAGNRGKSNVGFQGLLGAAANGQEQPGTPPGRPRDMEDAMVIEDVLKDVSVASKDAQIHAACYFNEEIKLIPFSLFSAVFGNSVFF